jgi:membrane protein YqaA with SNARE-associated domain
VRTPTTASRGGLWQAPLALGFVWGFAEATLFVIIPDVIIGWAALSDWRSGLRMLLAAISGAVAGGLVLYAVATARPIAALAAVEAVPFVHHAMIERVAGDYRRLGPWAILFGPGNGVPYKVYAALAPPSADPVSFALLSIPARLERFLPAWLIFTLAGRGLRPWIASHPRGTALVFAAVWAIGYAVYWSVV